MAGRLRAMASTAAVWCRLADRAQRSGSVSNVPLTQINVVDASTLLRRSNVQDVEQEPAFPELIPSLPIPRGQIAFGALRELSASRSRAASLQR